jgi:hypothetical protein
MREKFFKYWVEVQLVTDIVNYLHPSFKKKYIVRLHQKYKKNFNLPHIGNEQHMTSTLEEMFNIYNTQICSNHVNQPSSSNPPKIRY